MSPYERQPRRHFSNQMRSPYFQSNHYREEHNKMEEAVEGAFKSFVLYLKKIIRVK